jgi:hypothetical protein
MIRIELTQPKDETAVTMSDRVVAEDLGELKRVRQFISPYLQLLREPEPNPGQTKP